jgi:hypothetical protein
MDNVKLCSQQEDYKAGWTRGFYSVLSGEGEPYSMPDGIGKKSTVSHILFNAGYLDGRIACASRDPTRHDVLIWLLTKGVLSAHTDQHGEIVIGCDYVSCPPQPALGNEIGQKPPEAGRQEAAPRDSGTPMYAPQITVEEGVFTTTGAMPLEDALVHMGLGVS